MNEFHSKSFGNVPSMMSIHYFYTEAAVVPVNVAYQSSTFSGSGTAADTTGHRVGAAHGETRGQSMDAKILTVMSLR